MRHFWRRATAPLFFVAVALVLMHPVLGKPAERVYGNSGDPLAEVWRQSMFKSGNLELFSSSPVKAANYPSGVVLRRPIEATQILYDAPSWLLAKMLPPILSYNVLVFLAIATSGYAGFWAARKLGLSMWSASFAGVLFTIAPVHLVEAKLHPALAQVAALPLIFATSFTALKDGSSRRAFAAGAIWGGTAYLNPYLFLEASIVAISALAVAAGRDRRSWRRALFAAGTALSLVVPLMVVLVVFRDRVDADAMRTLSEVRLFAADPLRLVTRGDNVYLGVFVLAAAVMGFVFSTLEPRVRLALVLAGLVAAALALPPEVEIFGRSVLMPSGVLYHWLPFFRVVGRFVIVSSFAFSLLAAASVEYLSRQKALGMAVASIAAAVLIFDLGGRASFPVAGRRDIPDPVANALQGLGPGAVAEYPLFGFSNDRLGRYLFRQLIHKRALFNGGIEGTHAADLAALASDPFDPATPMVLHFAGVNSVVINREMKGPVPEEFVKRASFDEATIFDVYGRGASMPGLVFLKSGGHPNFISNSPARDGDTIWLRTFESRAGIRLIVRAEDLAAARFAEREFQITSSPSEITLCAAPEDEMASFEIDSNRPIVLVSATVILGC